jgi:peptidoglycan hydrolase CwlO-like protein
MTNEQKIQSKLDELHEQFNTLQSQGASNRELNSMRRELNIYYEKLRKLC